ncbi:MAG: DNA primase [Proteobacteria bacterium]|nr:DNA primase [Pseudomonadota bacterium]
MAAASGVDRPRRADIDGSVIDQIKQRVDIIEIVGRHVELKRAGGALFKGLCPFHTERSPSFTVTPSRQSYHCFGCGAHGDAVQFLMEMEGMSFRETIEDMAQSVGVAIPAPDPNAPVSRRPTPYVRHAMHLAMDVAATFYSEELWRASELAHHSPEATSFPAQAAKYVLSTRGVHQSTIDRFRIGLAPEGWETLKGLAWPRETFSRGSNDAATTLAAVDLIRVREEREDDGAAAAEASTTPAPSNRLRFGFPTGAAPAAATAPGAKKPPSYYDTFRARLMFPVRDTAGKIVAFGGRRLSEGSSAAKYLNSAETPIFHKSDVLYGLYEAREAILRVKHALVVEGYMDVVMLAQYGVENSVASMGTAMTESQMQTLLRFTDCLVFVFDGDGAGQKAARKAAETILPLLRANHDIRILTLPDDKDPDEFVRENGREAFDGLVATAKSLSFFLRDQLLDECGGAKTPEHRARFQQRFQQVLKLMSADATLAKEYWKMFQDALASTDTRSHQASGLGSGFRRSAPAAPTRALAISASESSVVAKLREAAQLAPEIGLQVRDSIIALLDLDDPAELRLQQDLVRLDEATSAQRAAEGTPEWLFARDTLLSHASLLEGHRKEQIRAELKAQHASGELATGDYIRELRELG